MQPQVALLFGGAVRAHDAVDETEQIARRGQALIDRNVRAAAAGLPPAFL